MTSEGHSLAGALACVPALTYAVHDQHFVIGFVACAGLMFGARMPDWLEHPLSGPDHRWVAHRTLTHWAPLWLGLAWASHVWLRGLPAWAVYGIAGGCLLHILCDATTPMGVPLLLPFGRHLRFPGARSGSWHEHLALGVLGLLCLGCVWAVLRPFPVSL